MKTDASSTLRLAIIPGVPWHHRHDLEGVVIGGGASRRTKAAPRLDGAWKRLHAGHLWVMEVSSETTEGTLTLTCDLSRRLVYVPVPHGRPLCVHFPSVIAMTANMRVRSCTNLSFPAVCTRHIFGSYMECMTVEHDGGVILEVAGETCALPQEAEFDIARLVAWSPCVRFGMSRLARVVDIFVTPPYVRIVKCDTEDVQVIVEPGGGKARRTVAKRILDFLRVLLPV